MRIDTLHTKGDKQWSLNIGSVQFQFYLTRDFKWYRVKPLFWTKDTTAPCIVLVLSFFGLSFFWERKAGE